MKEIGESILYSFTDDIAGCDAVLLQYHIGGSEGHLIRDYFELVQKVAELQFRNKNHVLLFRGQTKDYRRQGGTTLQASIYRPAPQRNGHPDSKLLKERFHTLERAEKILMERYSLLDEDEGDIEVYRVLRWAILQHYEICPTPLLDVTHSLRIAASFASLESKKRFGYLYVLGVPNLSGTITVSVEEGLQIVRLSGVCPPSALRPHLQQGYLLGLYPEMSIVGRKEVFDFYEIDFGLRLIAKFKLDLSTFWKSSGSDFAQVSMQSLFPKNELDPLHQIVEHIKHHI